MGDILLDMCCGVGMFGILLSKYFNNIIGMDNNPCNSGCCEGWLYECGEDGTDDCENCCPDGVTKKIDEKGSNCNINNPKKYPAISLKIAKEAINAK